LLRALLRAVLLHAALRFVRSPQGEARLLLQAVLRTVLRARLLPARDLRSVRPGLLRKGMRSGHLRSGHLRSGLRAHLLRAVLLHAALRFVRSSQGEACLLLQAVLRTVLRARLLPARDLCARLLRARLWLLEIGSVSVAFDS
jgi:hypothetical protein